MGYGDVLLAAGLAESLYRSDPAAGPVLITTCDGRPRWRDEWRGNGAIASSGGPGIRQIAHGPGCSPWNPPDGVYRAQDHRPTLTLDKDEKAFAAVVRHQYGPFVLIEPTQPSRKNRNRFWPGWRDLSIALTTKLAGRYTVLQMTRPAADHLGTIPAVPHENFRQAAAVAAVADLCILPEGGLAIGAAAVGASAVVLWGGFGWAVDYAAFPDHVNVAGSVDRGACANASPCTHCADAWSRITVDQVVALAERKLADRAFGGLIHL